MQTLTVGRGYSRDWQVQLRDVTGAPLVNVYTGSEPLDLVICDVGAEAAAVTLTDSTVEWLDHDAGTVTLHVDDADTALMGAGPRGLTIGITDGGERYEAYRATLRVEPRPT